MTLSWPAGLLFLLALPLILWLHSRRRREVRVVVPSVTPWLALRAAVPPRRRAIPASLLLLMHLTVAALVAIALAAPSLPGVLGAARDRALVVDTTTSMAAGGRWTEALDAARAVVSETPGEVTLVTLAPRPEVLLARETDRGRVLEELGALGPGGTGADLTAALALARAVAGPEAEIVVVSDGGPATGNGNVGGEGAAGGGPETDAEAAPDSESFDGAGLTGMEAGDGVRWEVVGDALDNAAVVAVGSLTSGGRTQLFARLAAFGSETVAPLLLSVDGHEAERVEARVAADGTFETVWTLPYGGRTATVSMETGDELSADDQVTVPLEQETLRVELVGSSDAVERALLSIPSVSLTTAGPGSYRTDGTVDVTVFVQQVPEVLPPGGVMVFAPPRGSWRPTEREGGYVIGDGSAAVAGSLDESRAAAGGSDGSSGDGSEAASGSVGATASAGRGLASGIGLAGARLAAPTRLLAPDDGEVLLEAEGAPVVVAGTDAGSRIVVFGFDPDGGDIATRLAFPLLVARSVEWVTPPRPAPLNPAGRAVQLPPGT
ncbi:MAG: vWA domain-containing protein, partial [Anaerolineae bacterium]